MGKTVCVIGAGLSGLATAREMRDGGMDVCLYEASGQVGGVWRYTEDILGAPHKCTPVYRSLRVNIPNKVMAFRGFPFPSDLNAFVGHRHIKKYIERYAETNNLLPLIEFHRTVETVLPRCLMEDDRKNVSVDGWWVDGKVFDVVVVASGHYNVPRIPDVMVAREEGEESRLGFVIHSSRYDTPDLCLGKSVLVVGGASSGTDIVWEISKVCSTVIWSCLDVVSRPDRPLPPNCILISGLRRINWNGTFVLLDPLDPHRLGAHYSSGLVPAGPLGINLGSGLLYGRSNVPLIDGVIFATGYHHYLPFFHHWQNRCQHSKEPLEEGHARGIGVDAFETCRSVILSEDVDRGVGPTPDWAGNDSKPEYKWVEDGVLNNLVLNLFHRKYTHSLFFVGFMGMTLPTLLAETQAKAISAVITGRFPFSAMFLDSYVLDRVESNEVGNKTLSTEKKDTLDDHYGGNVCVAREEERNPLGLVGCCPSLSCLQEAYRRHQYLDVVRFPLVSTHATFAYLQLLSVVADGSVETFLNIAFTARNNGLQLPGHLYNSELATIKKEYELAASVRKIDPLFRDRDYSQDSTR